MSCPFQPPSILPISSSGFDNVIYFLLSIDLVSHNIIKRILSVSTLRIASRMYCCFSVRSRYVAIAIASIISTKNVSIRVPSE